MPLSNQVNLLILQGEAEVAELVDAHDSKSCLRKEVWVRFPPSVLINMGTVPLKMSKYSPLHPYGNRQEQFDKRYLEMARTWAQNSYCKRRQVGALIVKEKMIISDGYNGTPSGFENLCEDKNNRTKPYVLHAEANAITKVAKSNNSSEGATLYITSSPCMECAKLIIQSGIKRVVFCDKYRIEDGINLLKRANIEVVSLEL